VREPVIAACLTVVMILISMRKLASTTIAVGDATSMMFCFWAARSDRIFESHFGNTEEFDY
jgi:hypothetical protein